MTRSAFFLQRITWLAFLALALCLPFEAVQPWLQAGPLRFTNLELLAALALMLWALALLAARRMPRWPAWLWQPLLAWSLVLGLSALFAPAEQNAALKFALRSLAGVMMGLVSFDLLIHPPPRAAQPAAAISSLAWALATGALLAAALGCAEALWPARLTPWLSLFKLNPTRVAGTIRASGPFGYANIAAQFWEAALILLVVLLAAVNQRRAQVLLVLAIGLTAAALVLTASRGGLLAILLTGALLLVAAWWSQRRLAGLAFVVLPASPQTPRPGPVAGRRISLPRAVAIAIAVTVTLAGLQIAISPVQQARLQTEVEAGFMQAEYAAPAHLTLVAGQRTQVPLRLTNLGRLPWRAHGPEPMLLSYHWLDASAAMIVFFEGDRTVLPHDVPPGEAAQVSAYVLPPPQPGRYILAWDMLQNHVAWFSSRGAPLGHTTVDVMAGRGRAATPALPPPVPTRLLTTAQGRGQVPRATLWRAAGILWRQHPWLGVGPDNFRHLWGDALGLADWRPQGQASVLHSNSLYIEIFVTLGLARGACLAWLLVALAKRVLMQLRWLLSPAPLPAPARLTGVSWLLGLAAALTVFLIHGFFDYFLEFTPTYLLWWILVGSLAACTTEIEARGVLHRYAISRVSAGAAASTPGVRWPPEQLQTDFSPQDWGAGGPP